MARVYTQPPVFSDPAAFAPHAYQSYRDPRRGQQATLDAAGRYAQMYKTLAPVANLAANIGQRIYWGMGDDKTPDAAAQGEPVAEVQAANEDLRMAADRALRAERRDPEETPTPPMIHDANSDAPYMDPSGSRYQEQAQGDMERADPRSVGRFIARQKWQRDHVDPLQQTQTRLDANAFSEEWLARHEAAQENPSAQSDAGDAIHLGMGGMSDSAAIRQAAARKMGLEPLQLARKPMRLPGEDVSGFLATARDIENLPPEPKYDAARSMAEAKASQQTGGIVPPATPAAAAPAEQRLQALSDAELKKARDYAVMVAERPDARPEVMQKADAAVKLLDAEVSRRTGGNGQGAPTGQPQAQTPATGAPAAPAQDKRDMSKYSPRQLEAVHDNLHTQLLQMEPGNPQRARLQALADDIGNELGSRRQHEIAAFIPQGRMTMPEAFALARTADTAEKQAAVLRALDKVKVPAGDWTDLITGDHQKRAAAEIAHHFPVAPKKSPEELASIIARNYGSAANSQAKAATEDVLRDPKSKELGGRTYMEYGKGNAADASARLANRRADEIGVLKPHEEETIIATLDLIRARTKAAKAAAVRVGRGGAGARDEFLKHEKALEEAATKARQEIKDKHDIILGDAEKDLRAIDDDRRALLGKTGEVQLPEPPEQNADPAVIAKYQGELADARARNANAKAAKDALKKLDDDHKLVSDNVKALRKKRDDALNEAESALQETRRLAAGVNRKVIEKRAGKEGATPQRGNTAPPASKTPSAPTDLPKFGTGE